MSLGLMVLRSLRQHALSTAITVISVALATGLLISVWVIKEQAQATFTRMNVGYDAVLGARGSKLQLVLNAIFHLEASPGNLAWADYLDIQKNPNIELAAPLALGDNFRGYRLAGTLLDFFEKGEYAPGLKFHVKPGGRLFELGYREAVVGDFAARRLNLKVGDQFHPFHGLNFDEKNQHSETYVVVGILEPSNTPVDRVLWIPIEGIQKMTGHDPTNTTAISAVLVKLKGGSATAGFLMDQQYNKQGNRLTFAWPIGQVVAELFGKIAWFDKTLELIAYLVGIVAIGSVLASIYNSMNERRREIAILRALGARKTTILTAIVFESATIAALGVLIGFAVYAIIFSAAASAIRTQTGVVLNPFAPSPVMAWAPLGMIGLGALAGLVPAVKAYRTEVAQNLTPLS